MGRGWSFAEKQRVGCVYPLEVRPSALMLTACTVHILLAQSIYTTSSPSLCFDGHHPMRHVNTSKTITNLVASVLHSLFHHVNRAPLDPEGVFLATHGITPVASALPAMGLGTKRRPVNASFFGVCGCFDRSNHLLLRGATWLRRLGTLCQREWRHWRRRCNCGGVFAVIVTSASFVPL